MFTFEPYSGVLDVEENHISHKTCGTPTRLNTLNIYKNLFYE